MFKPEKWRKNMRKFKKFAATMLVYVKTDDSTGKIGDVTVKWHTTPNENNAYQNNLDEALLKQKDAAADDKIDIFLVEADYALKYVDTDYTMPIKDLGITDSEIADQERI